MNQRKLRTADLSLIALFASIIAVCSWISIPAAVPVTLQTFGVFLAVGVLGGKRGTLAVLTYLLMGVIGLPVFSGFGGGLGYLMGSTGGYLVGFVFPALVMWGMENIFGKRNQNIVISMTAGLLGCYAFGTIWFMTVYAGKGGAVRAGTVLAVCVVPYILPDILKMMLALAMRKRLVRVCNID